MENRPTATIPPVVVPATKTQPERQLGGPQSGFPPPFIVGCGLVPYLIAGLDFGTYKLRANVFCDGGSIELKPSGFSALLEDVLDVPYSQSDLVHSVKHCISEGYTVSTPYGRLSAADVTALLLARVKARIEAGDDRVLAKAVIAVPACFGHRQRKILVEAANAAGISVLALINEPTAAALDACFRGHFRNGKYLVISSGAYTFEASVIDVQNGLIEVKAGRGHRSLSGHSITAALVEGLMSEFEDVQADDLHVAVDRAKQDLSRTESVSFEAAGRRCSLSRQKASQLLAGHLQAIRSLIELVFTEAYVSKSEIDAVIVSGEATKLWALDKELRRLIPSSTMYQSNSANGAAIYAALLVKQVKDWVVWDALASPVIVAQGLHLQEIITNCSPLPIVGHALLDQDEDGTISATILQRSLDSREDIVKIATIKIQEKVPRSDAGANVDLSASVSADGLLSFSARHKALDVNLIVEVTDVHREGLVIDFASASGHSAPLESVSQLKAAISDAYANNSNASLVKALLDYAEYQVTVADPPNLEAARSVIVRAAQAATKLPALNLLCLRTLCDLCKIYIRQAAANPSTSRDDVETALEICDRIIVWTDQLVDAPRAVALLLYDLSVRFNDLAKIIYPQPQIDRLIRQAVAVVSSNCIPDVVKARFAELSKQAELEASTDAAAQSQPPTDPQTQDWSSCQENDQTSESD